MTYVGIDVSKLTFVVAYSSAKTSKTKTFKNTAKGIREFIKTISVDEHHCVMEATGNYSTLYNRTYVLSECLHIPCCISFLFYTVFRPYALFS